MTGKWPPYCTTTCAKTGCGLFGAGVDGIELDGIGPSPLTDGTGLDTDMVVISIGVVPESGLAKDAGLELGAGVLPLVDDARLRPPTRTSTPSATPYR